MKNLKIIPNNTKLKKGRYIITNFLAAGGMCNIYIAHDTYLKKFVVIKMMKPELFNDENMIRRFNREYDIINNFTHANIVNVFDRFNFENTKCIVLEYIKGWSLKDRLIKYGSLTDFEIKYIFSKLCDGLIKVHSEKIIHRDIKPENILLSITGEVKILDFGIAIRDDKKFHNTLNNKIIGTTKYMAPEILQTQESSIASDIYSLGIMLYEAYIGYPPFVRNNNAKQIAVQQILETPIPGNKISKRINTHANNLLRMSLAKDPAERPTSAKVFKEKLLAIFDENSFSLPIHLKNNIYRRKGNHIIKQKMIDNFRFFPVYLNLKWLIFGWVTIIALILAFFSIGYWI